jgi:hypothetical protein
MTTGHTNPPCKLAALAAVLTGAISAQTFADSAMVTNRANGHTYKRFDTPSSWAQARTACAAKGAHLATITSQQENDFLVSQLLQTSRAWIGGTDEQSEGAWKWVTGEPWSFQNWLPNQPDNCTGCGPTEEDYLELLPAQDANGDVTLGRWNDGALSWPYICEWERLFESIATLADITGDAIPDYATIYRDAGKFYLLTSNGATGASIKRVLIGADTTWSSASLSAANGDVSVLLSRSNGTAAIQVRDEVTLAVTATINLR